MRYISSFHRRKFQNTAKIRPLLHTRSESVVHSVRFYINIFNLLPAPQHETALEQGGDPFWAEIRTRDLKI